MKKLLLITALLLTPSLCFAGIKGQSVQKQAISILTEARRITSNCDSRLSALKTKVDALKAGFAGELSAGDKTKLTAVFSDIAAARSACSAATAEVDTQFPSIND